MYTKLFNGELTDNPDFNGSHCSAVADGTIYYGTISYSCPCLIKQPGNTRYDKEEPTFKPDKTKHTCHFVSYHVPDISAPQTWAVATFFVVLVIAAIFFLMFAKNIPPTTTPPYNKGVLAIFVLLLCMFIVTCCGMSANLNFKGSWPTAFASVSFTLFTLAVAGFLVYGLVTERPGQYAS